MKDHGVMAAGSSVTGSENGDSETFGFTGFDLTDSGGDLDPGTGGPAIF